MRVLGVQLSVDELIAVTGILVTVLLGGWAAVFATRADQATRRGIEQAQKQHDQEVRPRLEPVGVSSNALLPNHFNMEIANRGGATPLFAFVVQSDDNIFIASGSLDEHAREPFVFHHVGQLPYKTGHFTTPFVVAQDRMGRWWDCTLQHLLAGRLIEGTLREWLDARLKERGLSEMLEGQLAWRLLDYRVDPARIQRILRESRPGGGLLGRLRQRLRGQRRSTP
jgi:hypothetical protein